MASEKPAVTEPVTQPEKESISATNDIKKNKDSKDSKEKLSKKDTEMNKKKINDDQRLKLYNENLERQMVGK